MTHREERGNHVRSAKAIAFPTLISLLVLTACGDRGLDPDSVARAGDFRLSVEEVAEMVAPVGEVPNEIEVVEAVTDFWTEFVLLAWAANGEGELDRLDLDTLLEQQEMQLIISSLREEVIQMDAEISDEELLRLFEEERMGEQVRARHILLFHPAGATDAQRDSVYALAEELRDRARAGESFAALAEQYSGDMGSAEAGGDLDYFSRGALVPAFEEVAFALQEGEVSDVVETEFGLHVIRLEDRRILDFDELEGGLRSEIQRTRVAQAESTYLADLEGPANVQIADDAEELLREIAGNPGRTLGRRDAARALTTYEGGGFTAEEFRQFVLNQPSQVRQQIEMIPPEQVEELLRTLTRDELLLEDARRRGIAIDPSRLEELEEEIRGEYLRIAEFLDLDSIEPEEGESLGEAIDREVKELLTQLVRGDRDLAPLGGLAIPLRNLYPTQISEAGLDRAVTRIAERRTEEGVGDVFGPPDGAGTTSEPPPTVPDSPGREEPPLP